MSSLRSITMATLLVVAAMLALLAGCATKRIAFEKSGVAQAEKQRDEGACLREALGAEGSDEILLPYHIDRDTFNKCMEARGYTAQFR